MVFFSQLISYVCQKLTEQKIKEQGVYQLAFPFSMENTLPVSEEDPVPWLSWLSAQSSFPQFYWSHRDGHEEVAACGALKRFDSPEDAQLFLQQKDSSKKLRIWGLNSWSMRQKKQEGKSNNAVSYLFIPRIELRRCRGDVNLLINLDSTEHIDITIQFLQSLLPAVVLPKIKNHIESVTHFPNKAGWTAIINKALIEINAQQMEKVVPARKTVLALNTPLQAAEFMLASRLINHRCYHYMLAFDKETAFIASPPERLYYRKGIKFYTEALAGTVANDPDNAKAQALADWLLSDAKNLHENMVVVDDICQRLQGAVEQVDISSAEVIRLRKVQHLRRYIKGALLTLPNGECSDSECLYRLQPTAAVAGLPRQKALDYLDQNEIFQRNWYAGSGGYLSLSQAEFAVSLRCADISAQHVALYAGAGIVAGSDPEQEWIEIENKAAGLLSLLE